MREPASALDIGLSGLTLEAVTYDEIVGRLTALARRWGGDIVRVSKSEIPDSYQPVDGVYCAPFVGRNELASHWESKCILYSKLTPWSGFIHEMGHCFASTKPPDVADELDFLGWEWRVACLIGADLSEWRKQNSDYALGEYALPGLSPDHYNLSYVAKSTKYYRGLTDSEFLEVMRERTNYAWSRGLLDEFGMPRAIR